MKKSMSKLKSELVTKTILISKVILVIIFSGCIISISYSIANINGINKVSMITSNCHIKDKEYVIVLGSNGYYKCENCSKAMKKEILFMSSWQDLNDSRKKITNYFLNHKGNCI